MQNTTYEWIIETVADEDGNLPPQMTDAYDNVVCNVPQRFVREFAL